MRKFYIGYGHKSIGDCSSVTLFVEGASMLAVRGIQDWRLFSGQESSTRYIDFLKQKIAVPEDISATAKGQMRQLQEELRNFYLYIVPQIQEYLRKQYPMEKGEDPKVYERAIRARVFDIARGFLPAGMTTKTLWHMSMRQFSDELQWLRNHPLDEVRKLAEATLKLLVKEFPDSFSIKKYKASEQYLGDVVRKQYYLKASDLSANLSAQNRFRVVAAHLNEPLLDKYSEVLSKRHPKTELP